MTQRRSTPSSLLNLITVHLLVLLLLLIPLSTLSVQAQSGFTVKGTVTDPGGRPVVGVAITEKGTTNRVTTDKFGFYQINVRSGNATLVFYFTLSGNENVAVGSRAVINKSLKCSNGGTWSGTNCYGDLITIGEVRVGCPTGTQLPPASIPNRCIPTVKFHSAPNVSLDAAQRIAIGKGWVLATPDEMFDSWQWLKLNRASYGMLYDGRLALPLQRDKLPGWRRGTNVGIPGKKVQGFYYVQKVAVKRSQSPPPVASCNGTTPGSTTVTTGSGDVLSYGRTEMSSMVTNPMLDGWRNRDPMLVEAGRLYLKKKGIPADRKNLGRLPRVLSRSAVRRWEFAPFMLRVMWKAVSSKNPTPAQDQFRRRFETYTACDDLQIARETLRLWNAHIGKEWTSYPELACSGRKVEVTTLSGEKFMIVEPCQEVSIHWAVPPTGYKYNTLGVLLDTRNGGKWTVEGFLPLDNPQFFGGSGRQAMKRLFKPMIANNLPNFDDKQNLRPLGNEMSQLATEAGIHAGGIAIVSAVVGTVVLGEAVRRTSKLVASAAQNAVLKTKDVAATKVAAALQLGVKKSYEVALKEATEAASKETYKVTARKVGKNFVKTLVEKSAGKVGKKGGQKAATKLTTTILSKAVSALAVFGILATMGEVFGSVISDAARTNEFDATINKAAKGIQPFSVKEILGNSPDQAAKALVFTKLVKMTIADPADTGKLTLALPPLDCPTGKKESTSRTCVTEVKFHSQAGLSLAQARNIARTKGWALANPSQVGEAWVMLDLHAYAFGRMSDGRFAVPVQRDFSNFKIGANIGARGGNQGFLYIKGKAVSPSSISKGTVISPSTSTRVKGANVTEVTWGQTKREGVLRKVGPKTWHHLYPDGKRVYTVHTEIKRDEWSVYLRGSMFSSTVINLHKKTVEFKTPRGVRILRRILTSKK